MLPVLVPIAILLGIPNRGLSAWLAFAAVYFVIWQIGSRLTASRIQNATINWRKTYYPDITDPAFIRFIDSLGKDLGGHFDNLFPQTPLAKMDWTTLQGSLPIDARYPCKRWLDFVLDNAKIDWVKTDDLGSSTLDDLVLRVTMDNDVG